MASSALQFSRKTRYTQAREAQGNGERMIPATTTPTANLAPLTARGRYMSVYGLTWGLGFGMGPVIGGLLHDQVGPTAIWWGGARMALLAALGFLGLARRSPPASARGVLAGASLPLE
ncbi:MFS transporter [Thermoflexus hugenholtzii]